MMRALNPAVNAEIEPDYAWRRDGRRFGRLAR
jgi:hypothetical protein